MKKRIEEKSKNYTWTNNTLDEIRLKHNLSKVEDIQIRKIENKIKSDELKLDLFDKLDFYKELNEAQLRNIQPKSTENGWTSIYDSPSMDSAIRAMTNDAKNAQKLKEHQEVVNHIDQMKKMEEEQNQQPKFQMVQTADYRSPAMIVLHEEKKVNKPNVFVRLYRRFIEKYKPTPKTPWTIKDYKLVSLKDPLFPLSSFFNKYEYMIITRMIGWPWDQTEETEEVFKKEGYAYWNKRNGEVVSGSFDSQLDKLLAEHKKDQECKEREKVFKQIKNKLKEEENG